MKQIALTFWERGDRVVTKQGPGVVTRPPLNPWAARPPVVVRLDTDGLEWEFAAYDLDPETEGEPEPRPAGEEHP